MSDYNGRRYNDERYSDAYCLVEGHNHATREEGAICSLRFQLAEARKRATGLVEAAHRWHELWAQDQRYTIWENTPEGQATHWAVSEEECAEFASDAFDCDKMRDDLREAEHDLIDAYETAKYSKSTSDTVSEVLWRVLS